MADIAVRQQRPRNDWSAGKTDTFGDRMGADATVTLSFSKRWRYRANTAEALGFLMLSGLLRRLVPMARWAPIIGTPSAPPGDTSSGGAPTPPFQQWARQEPEFTVARSIHRANLRLRGWGTCLDQALAGVFMLRRRGQPGTVAIGLRKTDDETAEWEGHAWLIGRSAILTGQSEASKFKVTTLFSWATLQKHLPMTEEPGASKKTTDT